LFLPDFCLRESNNLFSGVVRVISSNVDTDISRRPGEVGLYTFTGITAFSALRLF
jgi:hypothetical protein